MPTQYCFAFNKDGQRCMLAAGHTQNHSHMIEWTDDECWSPQQIQHVAVPVIDSYSPEPEGKCVACDHAVSLHPAGECLRCDCKAVIPE